MYLDYLYYTETYKGKAPEEEFNKLNLQAESILNLYTFNRISFADEQIKNTVCELVEYLHGLNEKGGKEIQSETVSTHSVTYANGDNLSSEQTQKKIIYRNLIHTGLLYRGV